MKARVIAAQLGMVVLAGSLFAGCGSGASGKSAAGQTASETQKESQTLTEEDQTSGNAADTSAQASQNSSGKTEAGNSEEGQKRSPAASGGNETSALLAADDFFTDRDQEQTADTSAAQEISVSDGQDVEITQEGVYVISGSASDVTIHVNAPDAKVQLVLDGLSISNEDKPAVYVEDANKVFVTTAGSTTNTLTVTGAFQADGDTNLDAVIFCKSDLTLNGQGTLKISSAEGNGISGKDDLVMTGGTYEIEAAADAIEAHDSVNISDGLFTIKSGKDAIHSEDSDDDTVGSVLITGGDFQIQAGDDGIQGTTVTQIDGGTFDITAVEGIEGTLVQINGGTISISASDDGINAAEKSSVYSTPVIAFNGGDTTIVMGQGDTDAVDSNGAIYVNDGTRDITAQMSSFDYESEGQINGGTVTVNGESITQMPAGMNGGGPGGMQGGGMQGGMRGGRPGGQ